MLVAPVESPALPGHLVLTPVGLQETLDCCRGSCLNYDARMADHDVSGAGRCTCGEPGNHECQNCGAHICGLHLSRQVFTRQVLGLEADIRRAFDRPTSSTWEADWCVWCVDAKDLKRELRQKPFISDTKRAELRSLAASLIDQYPEHAHPVVGNAERSPTGLRKRKIAWDVEVDRIWPVGKLPWLFGKHVPEVQWRQSAVDRRGYVVKLVPVADGPLVPMKPGFRRMGDSGGWLEEQHFLGGGLLTLIRIEACLRSGGPRPLAPDSEFSQQELERMRQLKG